MLLCVSTFINHGLKTNQNFEASVRSRIKRRILPQIIHSNRVRRNSVAEERRDTNSNSVMQTLCSFINSEELCSTVENSEPAEHSNIQIAAESNSTTITSQPEENDNSLIPLDAPRESLESLEDNIENILEEELSEVRRTNHERHNTMTLASIITTTASLPRTSTASGGTREHLIADHHAGERRYSRRGYHDAQCQVGYCKHGGICHFDPRRNTQECL